MELNPAYLTVTATSSDTTLVPDRKHFPGRQRRKSHDQHHCLLPTQSGTATITVSVNDGNVTVDDTFVLTVIAVNDAPVADPQSVSMPWNTSTNIVLTGSDVEESPLTFEIVDNPAHGSLSGSGANRQYTPTAGYSGTDSFTFKAYDGALYSVPATVSINVTAYTISGNAGVAGATLSYTDGTPKTVTADGSGAYSFQVPIDWSGTVTPSKAGYTFSPASMSYTNVQADQTGAKLLHHRRHGYHLRVMPEWQVRLSVTRMAHPRRSLRMTPACISLEVSYNWSGTVTPSKTGYGFRPASRTYTNVTVNQYSQDYTTTTARVYYVDKTNPACTDTGQVGSFAVPFCTITRGAYLASPVRSCMSCMARMQRRSIPSAAAPTGNPITYLGRPRCYGDWTARILPTTCLLRFRVGIEELHCYRWFQHHEHQQ